MANIYTLLDKKDISERNNTQKLSKLSIIAFPSKVMGLLQYHWAGFLSLTSFGYRTNPVSPQPTLVDQAIVRRSYSYYEYIYILPIHIHSATFFISNHT